MARIRSIKPEFFTSEQVVECSTSARLLFIGLWCFSDDQGVHPASAKRLKMEVFPADQFTDAEIGAMVDELKSQRLVVEFTHENQAFWWITGWKKHQKIDRPTNKFPAPPRLEFDEFSSSPRRSLDEDSTTAPPRKGMEGSGVEKKGTEDSCTEPGKAPASVPEEPPPDDPVVLTFPCVGTGPRDWSLRQSKINEYREAYPGVDVLAELRKARQWLIDNPTKRKTASGMGRFLNSWLAKAQNDGRQHQQLGNGKPNGGLLRHGPGQIYVGPNGEREPDRF